MYCKKLASCNSCHPNMLHPCIWNMKTLNEARLWSKLTPLLMFLEWWDKALTPTNYNYVVYIIYFYVF